MLFIYNIILKYILYIHIHIEFIYIYIFFFIIGSINKINSKK